MTINIVIYLDANYAVPATVMVRSILAKAGADSCIELFVLALGLAPETKLTMLASWPRDRLNVHWIEVDWTRQERNLAPEHSPSKAAYARILIDRLLPPSVEKVIVIDCDGVVLADIGELWQRTPEAHCLMAVRDPCVFRLGDDHSKFIQLAAIDKTPPYFNSGLMVVDLKKWRDLGISDRCRALGERWLGQAVYADQSLLNAVLRGAWEPLPLRWNCNTRHTALHAHPSLRGRVYPFSEVAEAMRHPGFVHFVSRQKPWNETPFHPHRGVYRRYLDATKWRDHHLELTPSRRNRLKAALEANLAPVRYYRQAARLRRARGVPAKRLADFGHLVAALAKNLTR